MTIQDLKNSFIFDRANSKWFYPYVAPKSFYLTLQLYLRSNDFKKDLIDPIEVSEILRSLPELPVLRDRLNPHFICTVVGVDGSRERKYFYIFFPLEINQG